MELEQRVTAALDAGDGDGAARLVIEGLGPQIVGYLRTLLRDEEEVGDVFSAWAENAWKGLGTWRREGSLRSWAYRVAWNAASRVHRDPYRRRRERLATSMASRLALSVATATLASSDRRASALEQVRATLTPEEQTLLTLRIDRDLSWREVAEVLAGEGRPVDEAALRKRFERLKERLGRTLREHGEAKKP